jgi:hypothetical protein
MGLLNALFSPSVFMPHGYCYFFYFRKDSLIWLDIVSDRMSALPCLSISFAVLRYIIGTRRGPPFHCKLCVISNQSQGATA